MTTVDDRFEIPCCGCTGTVIFVEPEPDGQPTFFHTMPYCARFDQTNTVDDIIKYMRDCVDAQRKRSS